MAIASSHHTISERPIALHARYHGILALETCLNTHCHKAMVNGTGGITGNEISSREHHRSFWEVANAVLFHLLDCNLHTFAVGKTCCAWPIRLPEQGMMDSDEGSQTHTHTSESEDDASVASDESGITD